MKVYALITVLLVCSQASNAFRSRKPKISDDDLTRIEAFLEYRDTLQSALDTCSEKHNLDMDVAKNLVRMKVGTPNANQKCFVQCIVEVLEFYKNGTADMEKVKSTIGPFVGVDILDTMTAGCESVRGSNDCDTAYKFLECTVLGYEKVKNKA